MDCYQTRYEDGVFTGTAFADEDPLVPGRMVLPGACVLLAPPPYGAGQQARWSEDAWVVETCPTIWVSRELPPIAVTFTWDGSNIIETQVPAPVLAEGQQCAWDGVIWTVSDISAPPELPPAPVLTPAEKLAAVGLTIEDLKALGVSIA